MSLRGSLARACCGVVGGTALGVRTPGQAFTCNGPLGDSMVPLRDSPVTDPKDLFWEGAVGWGVGGLIQSRMSSQKGPKGRAAWPEGKGEEAICPIFC